MAESVIRLADQHIASKIKQGSKALSKIKLEIDDLLSELKDANKLCSCGTELLKSYEVRNGMRELTRIAYVAEDEVDLLVSNSSPFFDLGFDKRASKKLRKLKEQTREVRDKLHQLKGPDRPTRRARGSLYPKGHLPADDDLVIGIDNEITRVVDQLTKEFESNDPLLPVNRLAIVSMGGSGKTTMARSIYNHEAIKHYFHFQAWVSVTQGWDTSVVLPSILKQVQVEKLRFFCMPANDELLHQDPNYLAYLLNYIMRKKTCLLVLDDVWDMQSLNEFIPLIQKDELDCCTYTIVITSRRRPLNHNHWCIHQPQRLTGEDSWELFSRVASKPSRPVTLEYHALAMEMLRKCEGLPLAVVALGRLLKTKDTKRQWQRVLAQTTGTDATSMYSLVNETLGLSYDELPNYLKPCFLYLGLFRQGSTISGGPLIRMWIAEGFVDSNESDVNAETLEEAGRRYLQELVDHTMVDVVSKTYTGKVKTIRLHDIMRDFCLLKAKEMDFLTVSSSEADDIEKTSRRAAINPSKSIILPGNNFHLRSLAILGNSSTSAAPERFTTPVNQRCLYLEEVCQKYKLLRVLDIFGIKSPDGTLPVEIGKLIHLTYLRIRTTNIQQIPKSIGKLRNLLTLDYRDVYVDKEIGVPNVLWKLDKLRHLYLPNKMSGTIEDLKLDTLKDLITLWGVGGGHWLSNEMNKMSSTLNKLYIHRISTEDQIKAVLSSPAMEENGCMHALALDWYGFAFENADKLVAKQSLTKLRLMGKAPDELHAEGLTFPSNLVKLELCYTQLQKVETMEHLGGLAFLKVLRLSKDSYVGNEWRCREGSFPVLEELSLANLPRLKLWELDEGAMPCLRQLSIVSCINLRWMPEELKSIRLEKLDIGRMPYNFINRLQKIQGWKEESGQDYHIIEHILDVRIRDS